MNGKISVIVPVYNVAKYLPECIESIINQSYSELEIILVDDGSSDGCAEICDGYSEKDKRIKVIHQDNAGAGAAKNTGLKAVTGDYVAFVDGDDTILPEMYGVMMSYMKDDVDIVQCHHLLQYVNAEFPDEPVNTGEFNTEAALINLLTDWKNNIFCNKLFKANLLNNIFFPQGHVIDDEFFTYKAVCNARKITIIPDAFYVYRIRQTSAMNSGKFKRQCLDRFDYLTERYEYVTERFPSLSEKYKKHMVNYFELIEKQTYNDREIRNVLWSYMRRNKIKTVFQLYLTRLHIKRSLNTDKNDTATQELEKYS